MGHNLLYYTIAGTISGAVMQWAGLDFGTVLIGSTVIPALALIAWRIGKFKGWV